MAKKDVAPKKAATRDGTTRRPVPVTTAAPAASTEVAVRPEPAAVDGRDGAAALADAVLLPVRAARRVLPESRVPVVLGVAALTLVGVLDPPVAFGVSLGLEALRRWGPE